MTLLDIRKERANLLISRARSSNGDTLSTASQWVLDDRWQTVPYMTSAVLVTKSDGTTTPNEITLTFNGLESPFITNIAAGGLPQGFALTEQDWTDINALHAEQVQALAMSSFQQSYALLRKLNKAYQDGDIKAVPFSNEREQLTQRAVCAIARYFGVELKWDGRRYHDGAISISAINNTPWAIGCGKFGDGLSKVLSAAKWRTGAAEFGFSKTPVYAHQGWGYFADLEDAVHQFAQDTQQDGEWLVVLKMENGQEHSWRGDADDQSHAEGLAIADATEKTREQVHNIVSVEFQQLPQQERSETRERP